MGVMVLVAVIVASGLGVVDGTGEFMTVDSIWAKAGLASAAGVFSGARVWMACRVMATIVLASAWSTMGVEVGRAGMLQAASRAHSRIIVTNWIDFFFKPASKVSRIMRAVRSTREFLLSWVG